jgi:hypothetical protein
MKRGNLFIVGTFLPSLASFLVVGALRIYLERFPEYGPVSMSTGQPIFPHYANTVFYLFAACFAIALLASILILRKATDGWPKVFAGVGVVLLIPLQAAFLLLMALGLFEK